MFTPAERGIANRGITGGATVPASDVSARATQTAKSAAPVGATQDERAIIDEVLLRGGTDDDALRIIVARAYHPGDRNPPRQAMSLSIDLGQPPAPPATAWLWTMPRAPNLETGGAASWIVRQPPGAWPGPAGSEARALALVQRLRTTALERMAAYTALANAEFNSLPAFVRKGFEPLELEPPAIDPYPSAVVKYQRIRAAFYRAGWPYLKRDILDHLEPATFFDAPVVGGLHSAMRLVLAEVERSLGNVNPQIAGYFRRSAPKGLEIGGFVPREIAGSNVLSNHAFGLAIDIAPNINPQLKTASTIAAFRQATGEDLGQLLVKASGASREVYERIERVSRILKRWLNEWLAKFDDLHAERKQSANDPKKKSRVTAIDNELRTNPDLKALSVLLQEFKRPKVEMWRLHGILSIPRAAIERFLAIGGPLGAKWGGEYERSKDIMHLELMPHAVIRSPGRKGTAERCPVASGLGDLLDPNFVPKPVNGPA